MKDPIIYYDIAQMYGTDVSSTKLAFELREDILEHISLGFNVELDFKNIRTMTTGWSRNLIGLIVRDKGEQFFKDHITIKNMSDIVRTNMLEGIYEVLV